MDLPAERKLELVSEVIGRLTDEFRVLTLEQHAEAATQKSDLTVVEPRFSDVASSSNSQGPYEPAEFEPSEKQESL
jgi:hypothetical protein